MGVTLEYEPMNSASKNDSPIEPELVDVAGARRVLGGVSARWLWGATKAGEIPCTRLGRRVMYRIDALREFAQRREGR